MNYTPERQAMATRNERTERTMVLWRRKDGSMGGTSYAGSPASSDMWNGLARYRYVAAGYCVVHMIVKAPDISETLAQIYADDLIRGGALWRFVDMRSRRDEDV